MGKMGLLRFSGLQRVCIFSPIFGIKPPTLLTLTAMLLIFPVMNLKAQYISVSPNPACAGDVVTITVVGSCAFEASDVSAYVDSTSVVLELDGNGDWTGNYNASSAGTKTVTASDICGTTFDPVTLTVVQLNDVAIDSGPTHSQWTKSAQPNYIALKSPVAGDVVTYKADVTPYTAAAGSVISWSQGVTPIANNLKATIAADSVSGPTVVTASACNCTTTPWTNWIFWASVGYNFSSDLDSDDQLSFEGWGGNISGVSNPKKAGSFSGVITFTVGGQTYTGTKYAGNKVEIIGTLSPSGIGKVLGSGLSLNPQKVEYYNWSTTGDMNGDPVSSISSSTAGAHHGPKDDTNLPQQTTPVHDKIFALDFPGCGALAAQTGYEGNADNFADYVYVGSGIKASDAGHWYSHVKATFTLSSVSASPLAAGSGNPTLPTTWGDSNW